MPQILVLLLSGSGASSKVGQIWHDCCYEVLQRRSYVWLYFGHPL